MTPYPVLIATHDRLQHLKQCIESLAKNDLASETTLYLAIDYPASPKFIAANERIYQYSKTITGFKRIVVLRRRKNLGTLINFTSAMALIFGEHDAIIMSEDDNLFHTDFLKYMNDVLNRFESDEQIFSVSGYQYPNLKFKSDSLIRRKNICSWGVGYWKEKWWHAELHSDRISENLKNLADIRSYIDTVGDAPFVHFVMGWIRNKIYADTNLTYYQYRNSMTSIFPSRSLVKNIGCDGSGMHSGVNPFFASQHLASESWFVEGLDFCDPTTEIESDSNWIKMLGYPKFKLWLVIIIFLLARSVASVSRVKR